MQTRIGKSSWGIWFILSILLAMLLLLAIPRSKAQEQRLPGQPLYCDNTQKEDKDPDTRMHNCECARTDKMCDAHSDEDRMKPGAMCKTFCRPDNCQCAGPCTHS